MPDGTDNDHDGFVDNYLGWDFAGAHANNLQQDNDPSVKSDSASHGVHVSGLASAVTNNGIGVASIARDARLMIVKVMADVLFMIFIDTLIFVPFWFTIISIFKTIIIFNIFF